MLVYYSRVGILVLTHRETALCAGALIFMLLSKTAVSGHDSHQSVSMKITENIQTQKYICQ